MCNVYAYCTLRGRDQRLMCAFIYILWCRAVFAQLPENIAHLGKYSTLGQI